MSYDFLYIVELWLMYIVIIYEFMYIVMSYDFMYIYIYIVMSYDFMYIVMSYDFMYIYTLLWVMTLCTLLWVMTSCALLLLEHIIFQDKLNVQIHQKRFTILNIQQLSLCLIWSPLHVASVLVVKMVIGFLMEQNSRQHIVWIMRVGYDGAKLNLMIV